MVNKSISDVLQRSFVGWGALASAALLASSVVVDAAPERSLAGIRIGRPASQIFSRYGNPSRIDTSRFSPQQGMDALQAMAGSIPGLPQASQFGLPSTPGGNLGLESPSPSPTSMPGGPDSLGGAFGSTYPGFTGPQPSMPGLPSPPGMELFQTGQPQQAIPQRAVTKYYYDYSSGTALIFTVGHKGLVEQIDAFAPWPWSPARTSRGIGVGSTYKLVIAKYGYPDSQRQNSDGTLVMDYSSSAHCAFTLLDGKVVGVSVALVE